MWKRDEQPPGTEDLEQGLRPGRIRDFAAIAVLTVAILAVFNSQGLVTWTERLPSNAASLWVAERASEWHELMQKAGAAQCMADARERLGRLTR